MESVIEVVLLKSKKLTLEGGISMRELIFSGEENGVGNVLDATFAQIFLVVVFENF